MSWFTFGINVEEKKIYVCNIFIKDMVFQKDILMWQHSTVRDQMVD